MVKIRVRPAVVSPVNRSIAKPPAYRRKRSDIHRGRRTAAYVPNEGCLCCLQIVSGVILTALLGIAIGVPLAISLHSASNDTELTSTTGAILTSSTGIPASSNSNSASTTGIPGSTTSTLASTTTTNMCTNGSQYTTQLLNLNRNATLPWTHYSFNYTTSNATSATITFALRNDPWYWYLDDVSVINGTGTQLLLNGGFETGNLLHWVYCNPNGANHSGVVTSAVSYSGQYSYQDGSVGAEDYLSQTFAVQPLSTYSISFWLSSTGNYSTFAVVTISN